MVTPGVLALGAGRTHARHGGGAGVPLAADAGDRALRHRQRARRARRSTRSTCRELRLTLLASGIIEAILDGRQPAGIWVAAV
jgi:hypothetical protein